MLINLDFKQIEVVVLALLSQDECFIKLLQQGTDIYKYFASIMYDKTQDEITDDERNSLKIPILGISYGKGAKKLARETGKSEEWCKEFIDSFYGQFPKVKELHNRWIDEVNKTGSLRMFDGVNLTFKYYDKVWSDEYNCWFKAGYKPTEIKNYPVQHTAFVFISTFVSKFYTEYALNNRGKYLLINTVHDSVMLDCRDTFVTEAINDLNNVLDKLPELMLQLYKLNVNLPIRADITKGNSWFELG